MENLGKILVFILVALLMLVAAFFWVVFRPDPAEGCVELKCDDGKCECLEWAE